MAAIAVCNAAAATLHYQRVHSTLLASNRGYNPLVVCIRENRRFARAERTVKLN
jgi:hypothetical protein